MKIISLLCAAFLLVQVQAQTKPNKVKLDSVNTISVQFSPLFLLASGFRAGTAIGYKNWEFGLISYSHEVFDDVQEIAFEKSEGLDVKRNSAIQAHASWYAGKRRRNFFVGGGISPEWYSLKDTLSNQSTRISTTYALLRTGATIYPFQDYIYLSFQLHVKYAISGTQTKTFEGNSYEIAKLTGIPHWSIGVRLPLKAKN